jgi:hypothetical protein
MFDIAAGTSAELAASLGGLFVNTKPMTLGSQVVIANNPQQNSAIHCSDMSKVRAIAPRRWVFLS